MKIKRYRELLVWQKAMQLTKEIYDISMSFPKTETYGLTSQMRRCAISVPSNIAEGHSRDSLKEYLYFLSVAQGSRAELETQISLARMCDYMDIQMETYLLDKTAEVGKMMRGLQKNLTPNP